MTTSDLHVEPVSHALSGKKIEVIVTGSIGAVESVRFVRSLRRLGANVRVTMSKGASQFVTPLALEWASAHPVATDFTGSASHVVNGDACVVAPASANFLHKLAAGITDTPSSALATSYCGANKPVMILPNMHSSLADAPAVKENLAKVATWGVIVPARTEEGKKKFPEPQHLADFVAHNTNRTNKSALVACGGTKAYIDDVRFLGNYSSGSLGTHVTEELYRRGFTVTALAGTAEVLPTSYSELLRFETNAELKSLGTTHAPKHDALVFAPAVLDYVPKERSSGKTRSGAKDLKIELVPTEKIIAHLTPKSHIKVGFKLEPDLPKNAAEIAKDYLAKYNLSAFIINSLNQVSRHQHTGTFYESAAEPKTITGKQALAVAIADHIERGLA